MAKKVYFDLENVTLEMSRLEIMFSNFSTCLEAINDYIETNISASVDSAIFGEYGSKLLQIWSANASTFGDFHANFEAWSEAVTVIKSNNEKFSIETQALYRDNANSLDGIQDARKHLTGEMADISQSAQKVYDIAEKYKKGQITYEKIDIKTEKEKIKSIIKDEDTTKKINSTSIPLNFDIDKLAAGFKNNKFRLKTGLLSKYYSANEIDQIVADAIGGSSGAEASVTAALTLINLGLEKGITTEYNRAALKSESRPYTTDYIVNKGADCASFMSWVLNHGTSKTFNNADIPTFTKLGTKEDYSSAKVGDIIVRKNKHNEGGHVMMVIKNNPQTGEVTVADCSSQVNNYTTGIRVQKVKYKTLKKSNYVARDMTNFYG